MGNDNGEKPKYVNPVVTAAVLNSTAYITNFASMIKQKIGGPEAIEYLNIMKHALTKGIQKIEKESTENKESTNGND